MAASGGGGVEKKCGKHESGEKVNCSHRYVRQRRQRGWVCFRIVQSGDGGMRHEERIGYREREKYRQEAIGVQTATVRGAKRRAN